MVLFLLPVDKDYFLYCKKKICSTLFYNSPAKANVPLFVQQAMTVEKYDSMITFGTAEYLRANPDNP